MSAKILSVKEAAKRLDVKPDVVTELLESGDLPGRQIGGEWRTTTRALLSYVDGSPTEAMCCPPGTCCVPVEQSATANNCCG